ncbi:probable ATP-dependent RNA helicase ddx52 [Sesamum indicum]|uniref:Probable ATP-dependent RNA helicase ddx52 n=1 Tax=Sesamum indicum TaxID=4182 RepID=A0A6I9U341_SESIN|nr:probable ATP-dependent RNA helicase ddx52 [Sesamum indicum]
MSSSKSPHASLHSCDAHPDPSLVLHHGIRFKDIQPTLFIQRSSHNEQSKEEDNEGNDIDEEKKDDSDSEGDEDSEANKEDDGDSERKEDNEANMEDDNHTHKQNQAITLDDIARRIAWMEANLIDLFEYVRQMPRHPPMP